MSNFQVTLYMLVYGQVCNNVMYFDKTDAVPATDVIALANDIDTNWVANYKMPMAADVHFYQITVKAEPYGSGGVTYTKAIVQQGGNGFDSACPLNVAWVLRFESGLSGRRNHGRIYGPGLRPGYLDSGLISATGAALWPTRIAALKARYLNVGGTSDFKLLITNPHASSAYQIHASDIVLRTTPGSMRKRMLGVGS